MTAGPSLRDLVNLTPHVVRVYSADGAALLAEVPPSGAVFKAKAAEQRPVDGLLGGGALVVETRRLTGEVEGLPELPHGRPAPPLLVGATGAELAAAAWPGLVLVPDTGPASVVRGADGRVAGVRRLWLAEGPGRGARGQEAAAGPRLDKPRVRLEGGRLLAGGEVGTYELEVDWPVVRVWRLERRSADGRTWVRWERRGDGGFDVEDSEYPEGADARAAHASLPYVPPSLDLAAEALSVVRAATAFEGAPPVGAAATARAQPTNRRR